MTTEQCALRKLIDELCSPGSCILIQFLQAGRVLNEVAVANLQIHVSTYVLLMSLTIHSHAHLHWQCTHLIVCVTSTWTRRLLSGLGLLPIGAHSSQMQPIGPYLNRFHHVSLFHDMALHDGWVQCAKHMSHSRLHEVMLSNQMLDG